MNRINFEDFQQRAKSAESLIKQLKHKISVITSELKLDDHKSDKKQKDEPYEFIYWPLQNRGNYVRLIFAEAGVKYNDISDGKMVASRIRSTRMGNLDPNSPNAPIFQAMGPPLLKHGDMELCQTSAIMQYLGRQFNMEPHSEKNKARSMMITLHCMDINTEQYKAASDTPEALWTFLKTRLPVWLDILERPLRQSKSQEFYFENRVTYADIAVFNFLFSLNEYLEFGLLWDSILVQPFPKLASLYYCMKVRGGIKELLADQQKLNLEWFPVKMGFFNSTKFKQMANQSCESKECPSKKTILNSLKFWGQDGEKRLFKNNDEMCKKISECFAEKCSFIARDMALTPCHSPSDVYKAYKKNSQHKGWISHVKNYWIDGNRAVLVAKIEMIGADNKVSKPIEFMDDIRYNKEGKITNLFVINSPCDFEKYLKNPAEKEEVKDID